MIMVQKYCTDLTENLTDMKPDPKKNTKNAWLYISALGLLLCSTDPAAAQTQVGNGLVGSARLFPEESNNIVSFSPVFVEGKTIIRWLVQNDEKDGLFIVEKSADGIVFEAMGFKDRIGSPLCVNLFYSLTDELPYPGTTWYRIMAVSTDQTYSYSSVVRVKTNIPKEPGSSNTVLGN